MDTGGLGLLTCEVACGNTSVEGGNVSVRASYRPWNGRAALTWWAQMGAVVRNGHRRAGAAYL